MAQLDALWYHHQVIEAFPLSDAIVFDVSGRDAARYLNARLTADLRTPTLGRGGMAAALSAQGKVEAYFYVGCRTPESFLLVCDGGVPAAVLAAFRRFIVADRVTVVPRTDSVVFHLLADLNVLKLPPWIASPVGVPPLGLVTVGDVSTVVRRRSATAGIDVIFPISRLGAFQGWVAEVQGRIKPAPELLERRFRAALPTFPNELSPDRLFTYDLCPEAISFSKGCYVGQEVMEKVAAYGKAPRELRCLAIDGSQVLPDGATVSLDGNTIGDVLSAERAEGLDGSTYCFVSIRPGQELLRAFVSGRPVRAVVA